MATELAKAYIQVVPTTKGIKSGLEEAMNTEGQKSGQSFGGAFLKAGAGIITAGVGAVTAAAGAVWSAANATASVGDEIDKTSQKIGVSAEQYQALAFAADHCGFEVSTFQTAARNLANTDFDGNITDAVNSIMELDDVSERTAKAQELFGDRATQAMAPLLNGTEDLEDFKNQLAEIGGLMSDDSVAASAAFEDSFTNLQTAFSGLQNGLMGDFLPVITQVMDGITLLINGDDSGMAMIKDGINGFLESLNEMVPQFLDFGMQLISDFADVIIDNLPQIIELGIELILKLIVGLVNALPKLVAKIPEIIKAVVKAFQDAAPSMSEAGKNLISGLWEGIKAAKDWIKGKLTEWVGDITDFIKGLFGIASPSKLMRDAIGQYIPQGIAVGIEANTDAVTDAMRDMSGLAVNAFDMADLAPINYSYSKTDNGINDLIRAIQTSPTNVVIRLEGDADRLFKVMQSESISYNKRTGQPAFA